MTCRCHAHCTVSCHFYHHLNTPALSPPPRLESRISLHRRHAAFCSAKTGKTVLLHLPYIQSIHPIYNLSSSFIPSPSFSQLLTWPWQLLLTFIDQAFLLPLSTPPGTPHGEVEGRAGRKPLFVDLMIQTNSLSSACPASILLLCVCPSLLRILQRRLARSCPSFLRLPTFLLPPSLL